MEWKVVLLFLPLFDPFTLISKKGARPFCNEKKTLLDCLVFCSLWCESSAVTVGISISQSISKPFFSSCAKRLSVIRWGSSPSGLLVHLLSSSTKGEKKFLLELNTTWCHSYVAVTFDSVFKSCFRNINSTPSIVFMFRALMFLNVETASLLQRVQKLFFLLSQPSRVAILSIVWTSFWRVWVYRSSVRFSFFVWKLVLKLRQLGVVEVLQFPQLTQTNGQISHLVQSFFIGVFSRLIADGCLVILVWTVSEVSVLVGHFA